MIGTTVRHVVAGAGDDVTPVLEWSLTVKDGKLFVYVQPSGESDQKVPVIIVGHLGSIQKGCSESALERMGLQWK